MYCYIVKTFSHLAKSTKFVQQRGLLEMDICYNSLLSAFQNVCIFEWKSHLAALQNFASIFMYHHMIRVTKHYFLPFNDWSCFTVVTLMSRDKGLDALKIHGMMVSLSSCRFSTKETKILLITFNKHIISFLRGKELNLQLCRAQTSVIPYTVVIFKNCISIGTMPTFFSELKLL